MSDKLELAKKLKRLADSGADGEKYNAQQALEKLMAKYGISDKELESNIREWRFFKVRMDQRSFIKRVALSVIGDHATKFKRGVNYPTSLWFNCTELERLEIEAKFQILWNAYKKDLEVFFSAFCMKHDLYNKDGEAVPWESLTTEQKRRSYMASQMVGGISDVDFRKELGDGS